MAAELNMEQLIAILRAQESTIRGLQRKVAAMEQTQLALDRNQQAIAAFVNKLEATVSTLTSRLTQAIATVQAVGGVRLPLRASDSVVEPDVQEERQAPLDLSRFRGTTQTEDDAELMTQP